jgi:hypothetical protein
MNCDLTKRAAHLMAQAPSELSVRQALRFGQLRGMGVPEPLLEVILKSAIASDFHHDGVWLPFFMMLARAPRFDPADLPMLIRYLREEIRTRRWHGVSLKGRTLHDLIRSARRSLRNLLEVARKSGYDFTVEDLDDPAVRDLLLALAATSWMAMPGVERFDYRAKDHWEVVELCTQEELRADGEELSHCVSMYGPSCRSGKSAIFSLRIWSEEERIWDPWVTIEVDPRRREVVQIRSVWNLPADRHEIRIIALWAEANAIALEKRFLL